MKKSEVINNALDYYFPNPKCELEFNKDYELLLAVMLSAQSTDKRVNLVTKDLFKKYNTLEKLNKLSISEIESLIKTIGISKTKAKNFKGIVECIVRDGGFVQNNRELLETYPGIGRKSVNVVLSVLYNEPCIAVDTHVTRVSKRLNLANEKDDVLKIEQKLMKIFPKNKWIKTHMQMVLFGRYCCKSKKPECENCLLQKECKYYKNSK